MKHAALGLSLSLALGFGCGGDYAGSSDVGGGGGGNVGFGGAQDIGQFRELLERGEIPGRATLDANGFFNEHYAELPEPDCGQLLCAHGMLSVDRDWRNDAYQATLQIAINTTESPADIERDPLNMVVVVDTSGSMNMDQRIEYVREGLGYLIDTLEEEDRLAIVTYSDFAMVRAGLAEPLSKEDLHVLVDGLQTGGSTNIYDGLETGFGLLAENWDAERQNRLVFLSDGLATAGIRDDVPIIDMAEAYISDGIGLTTIGVGDDFNVDLMRGLAERGAGNFYFLEDAAAVAEVFTEELSYFIRPLALEVELAVQTAASYEVSEVLGTRLWEAEGSSGSMYVPAVFLASRQSDDPGDLGRRGGGSSLFLALQPRAGTFEDPAKVAEIQLRYRLPGSDEILEQTVLVENPYRDEVPDGGYYSDEGMTESYAMYNVFLGLRDATIASENDYNQAYAILDALATRATAWNAIHEDPDIAADLELVAKFQANLLEHGANPDAEWDEEDWECLDGCEGYDEDIVYHCSMASGAGGASSVGLLVLGLVLGLGRRRRRAR